MKGVPKLRFGEDREPSVSPWIERRVGDIGAILKGDGISKDEVVEDGEFSCIQYGELFTKYSELISSTFSKTDSYKGLLSVAGDILMPDADVTPLGLGRSSCLRVDGVKIGYHTTVVRPHPGNDPLFICYAMNSRRRDFQRRVVGTTIKMLYPREVGAVSIPLPSLPEQRKIASALTSVDTKIDLFKRKKAALSDYKRGLMQKLFSQEIRFTPEGGGEFPAWEKKRLGEVASRVMRKNTDMKVCRVLTNSATLGVVDQGDYFDREIANPDNIGGYSVVTNGDFVYNPRISVSAPVGPISRSDLDEGVMSPLYTVFRFKFDNTDFYRHYFRHDGWHGYMRSVANYGARHDRMAISNADFLAMPIPEPSVEEQRLIASALSAMDTKIDAVTSQIASMETFKRGLLQQLFP